MWRKMRSTNHGGLLKPFLGSYFTEIDPERVLLYIGYYYFLFPVSSRSAGTNTVTDLSALYG